MAHKTHHRANGRIRLATLIALAAIAVLGVALVVLPKLLPMRTVGRSWLLASMTSRLFVFCGLVALACLAGLIVILATLWQAGRRPRPGAQEGTAMIEFALALPFALMLCLILAQATLLMVGNLCVHYAAYCAARTAIVAIPDGPRYPSLDDSAAAASSEEIQNIMLSYDYSASAGGYDKAKRIWQAAVWGVLPISGCPQELEEADVSSLTSGLDDFFTAYGQSVPHWVTALLGRKFQYASQYTAVEVSSPADGEKYAANEDVCVQVEHTFYLAVPYAARLFAQLDDGVTLDFGDGQYGTVIKASCTLTNEGGQDYVEREQFPRVLN